jgi:hypothetical protein
MEKNPAPHCRRRILRRHAVRVPEMKTLRVSPEAVERRMHAMYVFHEPFLRPEHSCRADTWPSILDLRDTKLREGKPPSQAASEIIRDYYRNVDHDQWIFLEDVKRKWIDLLSGGDPIPALPTAFNRRPRP